MADIRSTAITTVHMARKIFASAFAHSCNSAFAQIGVDLNRSEYVETVKGLLFNTQLPIDLPYRKCNFDLEAKQRRCVDNADCDRTGGYPGFSDVYGDADKRGGKWRQSDDTISGRKDRKLYRDNSKILYAKDL